MGVIFKNNPAGKVQIVKAKKDGKTGTTSEEKTEMQVVAPHLEGPTMGFATLEAPEPFAEVGVSLGFTIGLPNYSSARCDITLKMPTPADQIDKTYEFAQTWVTTRLEAIHKEMSED